MEGFGAGKDAAIIQVVVQVHALMSGIMPRQSLIFSRLLNEHSVKQNFFQSQDKEGHQTFRSALPIRPVATTFYAASDGQLGGIMKMYRDWRISGNRNG